MCILLLFCSEGDNASDALQLAKHANSWLNIIDMEVIYVTDDNKAVMLVVIT